MFDELKNRTIDLVIVTPTGAMLHREIIANAVKTQTGAETVRPLKSLSVVEMDLDNPLVLWVHKDAPEQLPMDIWAAVQQYKYGNIHLFCTCPACGRNVQYQVPGDLILEKKSSHWYCADCNEQSTS